MKPRPHLIAAATLLLALTALAEDNLPKTLMTTRARLLASEDFTGEARPNPEWAQNKEAIAAPLAPAGK